ncbi:MAG TPA: CehA/McbA family metallohydrolase, partial [Candidatus Xenobia bacterium]
GSARREFTVSEKWATPGYLPGLLPAGQWHVILGLYRIMPGGAHVLVDIELLEEPWAEAVVPPAVVGSGLTGPGWYVGDQHCHTEHSDAKGTLQELLTMARARGLDYLGVTDHNTISHHAWLRNTGMIALTGEEMTTYRGHATVLNADGWVDFRAHNREELVALVEDGRRRGGLWFVAHPKQTGCDWEWGDDLWDRHFDGVEVWNGVWAGRNWQSVARWHRRLAAGARLVAVGGSDRHQPHLPDPDQPLNQVGSPATRVWADGDIVAGLKSGKVSVAEAPTGPWVWIERDGQVVMGETVAVGTRLNVRVIGDIEDGTRVRVLTDQGVLHDGPAGDVSLDTPSACFVRAEVYRRPDEAYRRLLTTLQLPGGISSDEMMAHDVVEGLSNPVYTQQAKPQS